MAAPLVTTLGFVAALVSCIQFVPQVVRTIRTRDTDGVSGLMWALLLAQSFAWITFGLRAGLLPSVTTNVVLGAAAIAMLWLLQVDGAPGVQRAYALVATALAVEVAVAVLLPNAVMGVIAASISTVAFVPQAVAALRESDLSGLSKPMWVLSIVAGGLWFTYGLGVGQAVVCVSSAIGTALSVVVLAQIVAFERSTRLAVADR